MSTLPEDLEAAPAPAVEAIAPAEPAPVPVPAPAPAHLFLAQDPQMRLEHDGIAYEPVPNDAALGALLFALRPSSATVGSLRHADREPLRMSLDAARQFERVLQGHAARADRASARLPGRVTVADLRDWVLRAAKSVPAAELERFAWRLSQRLGDDPWSDGSPLFELSGQQFGLFRTTFEEREGGVVVATGIDLGALDEAGVAVAQTAPEADAGLATDAAPEAPAPAPAPAVVPAPAPAPAPKKPRAPRRPKAAAAAPAEPTEPTSEA